MKVFISSLVLFSLLVGVFCTTAVYTPIQRTITTGEAFLKDQRLPACSEVYYTISNLNSLIEGDLITILYVPRTDNNTPPPNSTVTIGLMSTSGTTYPVSSVINQTYNSIPYLSQTAGCDINSGIVSRAPGNANSGCGLNFYCSGFKNSNTTLKIRIATTGNENLEGILFDLNVQITSVSVPSIKFDSTFTATVTPSAGSQLFKPTVAQKHYKVYVGPTESNIYTYANFLSAKNSMTSLRFSLTNLKVNGVSAQGDQGLWSLNVNYNDISQANSDLLLSTDPQQPCVIGTTSDAHFYNSTNTKLVVDVEACDVTFGYYYISVGLPQTFSTSYSYDLMVSFVANEDSYIPNYKNLTVNNPINDVVGDFSYYDGPAINYYLLNISTSNFAKGDYFFVTLTGINFGSASIQITQGCYGYNVSCNSCKVIAECNRFSYYDGTPDEALDYCKLKVDPCEISVSDTLPFFVTVVGNQYESNYYWYYVYNYNYISYTISLDIVHSTALDITTLSKTIGNGWVEYTYSGQVNEQEYNHFVWNFDLSTVSEFYLLTAHMFVDQEQDEVIFTHNVGSLAGSGAYVNLDPIYYFGSIGSFDECYGNDYACNTRLKTEFNSDYIYIDQIGSCRATLPYCDILHGSSHYFSVYAVDSSPTNEESQILNQFGIAGLGYNRPVDYTIVWRLFTAPISLQDSTVVKGYVNLNDLSYYSFEYSENFEEYYVSEVRPNELTNTYTPQYKYSIPTGVNADSVRIALSDIVFTELNIFDYFPFYTLHARCGNAAGSCPCFESDYSCTVYSESGDGCEIYFPTCECDGPIYISVQANFHPHGIATFTLAAFAQTSEVKDTIDLSQKPVVKKGNLVPHTGFNPITVNRFDIVSRHNENWENYYFEGAIIYSADLFVLPDASYSSTTSLRFTMKYSYTPGKQQTDQFAIMSIGNGVIPPSSPFLTGSGCSQSCFAFPGQSYGSGEGSSYCTITIPPCELGVYGDIYVRVYGVMPVFRDNYESKGYFGYSNDLSFAGITYTINVAEDNYTPLALLVNTPHYDRLFETQYRHYSLALPKLDAAMNIFMYRNSDEIGDLTLYYNPKSFAGDTPCYNYEKRCQLIEGNTVSSACQIFIPMCEYTPYAGKTVYMSVRNEYENPNRTYSFSDIQHIPGELPLEYTIAPEISVFQTIDLSKGHPLTGNLRAHQQAYYTFTITQADIDAGKVFTIELDSIEPYLGASIVSYVSETNPASSCTCSGALTLDIDFFRYQTYNCELLGRAGTYYLVVSVLRDGLSYEDPFNTVSYTLRGWFLPPVVPIQTLPISETIYTIPPFPLNFNQFIIYKVPYTRQEDSLLYIEIADLQSTLHSSFAHGIEAVLNFGHPGSDSNLFSLFGGNQQCYEDNCFAENIESDTLPAGTVMCRFIVAPCQTTSSDNTLYVTIFPQFDGPEPRVEYRVNYTIRAFTKTIPTLDFFPDSDAYRTDALATNGYAFTINNLVPPTIQCDSRFGTNVWGDYYFKLSSIQVNQYERFTLTNADSESNDNIYMVFEEGTIPSEFNCGCPTIAGESCEVDSGCTTGSTTNQLYGFVGYFDCPTDGALSGSANGAVFVSKIDADRVYTQLPTVQMTINLRVNKTLAPGQFIVHQFNFSQVSLDLYPVTTYSLKFSGNQNATDRTCFSTSIPIHPDTAVVFPGTTDKQSSYCSFCEASLPSTPIFSSCCVDPNEIAYLTIYNPLNSGVSFSYEYEVIVNYLASNYSEMTLPIHTSFVSVGPTYPITFSFDLLDVIQYSTTTRSYDSVLNLRFRSTNGTADVYLNAFSAALPNSDCTAPMYHCLTSDAEECIIQVPACDLAKWANSHNLYEMYVGIVSHTANAFVGTVNVDIFAQYATEITLPSTTPFPSGFVPDEVYVPLEYYSFYKFPIKTQIGDFKLEDNKAGYKVTLIPTGSPNSLELSIHYPSFSTNRNPLAGTSTGTDANCQYTHDPEWKCYHSNDIGGTETRLTLGNVGVTCLLYFCDDSTYGLVNGQYIYISVQNVATTNRVVSNFQLSLDYNYVDLPSSEALYTMTPDAAVTNPAVVCSTSQFNTTGCTYAPNDKVTTAYFLLNLQNISQWATNDYLIVNITDFNNDLQLSFWAAATCEPSSTNFTTCTPGSECFIQMDPCTFSSLYRSDPGNNKYTTTPENLYVRVSGLKPSTTFIIQTPRVTPYAVTVPLNSSQLTYTQTFVSWDRHFTMFNFQTPKDDTYDFTVSVTTECTSNNGRVVVYRNFNNAQWATNACRDTGAFAPISYTDQRCEAQGNHFLSVLVGPGAVKYPAIELPEGYYSPQVRFTVTASLTKSVYTTLDYCWECNQQLAAGTTNLIVDGDNENFGTTLRITLTSTDTLSMRVVSPLFRESTLSSASQSFLDGTDSCSLPNCNATGVYCCNNVVYLDDTVQYCTINIPACNYRNGRFFIIANLEKPGVISSKIYRQDYPILTVGESNDYKLTVQGEIPIGPNRVQDFDYNYLGNQDGAVIPYYQFYKIVPTGEPYFLQVQVQAFVEELIISETGINYDYEDFVLYRQGDFPNLVVSLRRGENPTSTSVHCTGCTNCETSYCTTEVPGTCYLGDTNCVATAYYLSVSFDQEFDFGIFENCDLIQYEITVLTRNTEPITEVLVGDEITTVCGNVQGIPYNPNNFPDYDTTDDDDNEDDYDLNDDSDSTYIYYPLHDEPAGTYPNSQSYYIDTSSLGEHDDVYIEIRVRPTIDRLQFTQADIIASVSTQNPATPFCNDCEVVSETIEYDYVNQIYIECANLTHSGLWITITAARHNLLILDYAFYVAAITYPITMPVIPNLVAGIPATVVTNVTGGATIPFTPNHQYAIMRDNQGISSGINYNHDCVSGCPDVEPGCIFLGSQENYYMYTSGPMNVDLQLVHTVDIAVDSTTSISAYVYAGGYELIYVPYDDVLTFSNLDIFVVSATGDLTIEISYFGFSAGTGCSNALFAKLNNTGIATIPASYSRVGSTCNSNGFYITIYQADQCGSGAVEFTLGFQVRPLLNLLPIQALPTNQWVAGNIPVYGLPTPTSYPRIFQIQATNQEILLINIANANNSISDSFTLSISSGTCSLGTCSTIVGTCSVAVTPVTPNQTYYAFVSTVTLPDTSLLTELTFRIQALNTLPNLETTVNNHYQALPRNLQIFKVNGRQNGSPTGEIQSVVITTELIDGNPLIISVSDRPDFNGWRRSKICDFGTCTLEFPTRASHPGFSVFYVSVRVDSGITLNFVKPTNYKIYATTGLKNCETTASFISGFCLPTVSTLSHVYKYRDAEARNAEAQARVESFSCKCPYPQAECVSKLTRFSCLESFRECDSHGFWTPLCRNECEDVVSSCGPWHSSSNNCTCERPEFSCGSSRYSDDDSSVCTGHQVIVPSATPSASPAPSRSPAASVVPVPSASPSPSTVVPSSSPSPSELPEPSDNDTYRTYIIVNSGSNLSLSVAVLMMMVAFLLF